MLTQFLRPKRQTHTDGDIEDVRWTVAADESMSKGNNGLYRHNGMIHIHVEDHKVHPGDVTRVHTATPVAKHQMSNDVNIFYSMQI